MNQTIKIAELEKDKAVQARAELHEHAVKEYAMAIRAGAIFPPVVAFRDAEGLVWLADGFHRVEAHKRAGREDINAEIRTGEKREAILFAVGANGDHGLRRSNADKRRGVQMLLADAEWSKWSDGKIAELAGVSQPFVSSLRPTTHNRSELKGRDGKTRKAPKPHTKQSPPERPATPAEQTEEDQRPRAAAQKEPTPAAFDEPADVPGLECLIAVRAALAPLVGKWSASQLAEALGNYAAELKPEAVQQSPPPPKGKPKPVTPTKRKPKPMRATKGKVTPVKATKEKANGAAATVEVAS